VPDVADDALWYALACQLSATGRPSVRIKHPVLTRQAGRSAAWQSKIDALQAFARTEPGRSCNGVLDALLDAAAHG